MQHERETGGGEGGDGVSLSKSSPYLKRQPPPHSLYPFMEAPSLRDKLYFCPFVATAWSSGRENQSDVSQITRAMYLR